MEYSDDDSGSEDAPAPSNVGPKSRPAVSKIKAKTSPSHLELMQDLQKMRAEALKLNVPHVRHKNDANNLRTYQSARIDHQEENSCFSAFSRNFNYMALFVVVISVSLWTFWTPSSANQTISSFEDILKNLDGLAKDFPSQSHRTWISLKAGARDFTNSTDAGQRPLVLLLTGRSTDTRCLGEKYVQAFGRELHFLDAAEVSGKDYGETIDLLKKKINKLGAVLLHGLHNLDGNQAEALHVVCDRESPLVRDAVVVLTSETSLNDIGDKWKNHVAEDKLPALLTRIGSRVVVVSSENNLPCAV